MDNRIILTQALLFADDKSAAQLANAIGDKALAIKNTGGFWKRKIEMHLGIRRLGDIETGLQVSLWKRLYNDVIKKGPISLFNSHDPEAVKLGIEYGLDPSYNNNILIKNAIREGNIDLIKMLLNNKGVFETVNLSQLEIIATNLKRNEIARYFLALLRRLEGEKIYA
jgi:hypothetical protein